MITLVLKNIYLRSKIMKAKKAVKKMAKKAVKKAVKKAAKKMY